MKNNKLVKLISAFIIGVVFILTVMAVLMVTGVISIGKSDIVLVTGSMDALYDGSPLTNHEFKMVGELKDGHRIEYEFISSQTVVGESPNELSYKIFDELDADVTADYNIKHEYGTLKVNPRIVLVICEDTKNRIPREDEYYVDKEAYDGLVYDHKLVFRETTEEEDDGTATGEQGSEQQTAAQQTGTGKKRWKPVVFDRNNNDVTANYHIIVNVNVNKGGAGFDESESEDLGETVVLEGEELAEAIINGDSNLIPPIGNENAVLFAVNADSDNKVYLKLQSYGNYTGQDWDIAQNYYYLIENTYSAWYLTSAAIQNTSAGSHNISIISHCGRYALPYYVSLMSQSDIQPSDVEITGTLNGEYVANYYLYNSRASLPDTYKSFEASYAEFVRDQYLDIDATTLKYMEGIIEREGFDINDPDIINKVANFIQGSADYNLKYDRNLDKESNVAIAFLESYQEGVCSHYSAAATLLYRALGIPARYTVGVVAYPNGEDYVNVPAKNAHAWVEVYIDGMGWIYVEVTGKIAGNNVEVGQSPADESECDIYGHDLRDVEGKEPDCTEIGWSDHKTCAREQCTYIEGFEQYPALGHDKNVVFATDPTCTDSGNEEYFVCTRCPVIWKADGETPIEEIPVVDALGHDPQLVEAIAADCENGGNDAYYLCSRCDCMFSAEDAETEILDIPLTDPLGHDPQYFEGVEPDCVNAGYEAYYQCSRCDCLFAEDGETPIDEIVILDALGHDPMFFEAIAPDCENDGNEAYYQCSRCECLFAEDGETPLEEVVILDALGHEYIYVEATEPDCVTDGNEAYYRCARCTSLFGLDKETRIDKIPVIEALGHDSIYHSTERPNCFNSGVAAYSECQRCLGMFDDYGNTIYEIPYLAPLGHNPQLVEATEAGCILSGNEEYYKCSRCATLFDLDQETTLDAIPVIPALGHEYVDVEETVPTCTEGGNSAYAYCERCGWLFDELHENRIDEIPWLDKLMHDKHYFKAMEAGCETPGNEAYYYCNRCETMWAADGETVITEIQLTDPIGHDKQFVEEIKPDCLNGGNDAYWECKRCGAIWAEDGEIRLKEKPILAPLGHDIKLVPAKEADCISTGNDPYCVCSRCGLLFDETGKNPIDEIPVIENGGHSIVYVPATEATCEERGNEAYHICEKCLTVWAEDGETVLPDIPYIEPLGHIEGKPDPKDHCNIKCERCGKLLKEKKHPGETYIDKNDGNKVKCKNCNDVMADGGVEGPGGGGVPDFNKIIYSVIPSTGAPIYLRESGTNYIGGGFIAVPEFRDYLGQDIPYSPNYLASIVAQASGGAYETLIVLKSFEGGYGLPEFMWFGSQYENQINELTYVGSTDERYTVPFYNYNFLNGAEPVIPNDATFLEFEALYRNFAYATYTSCDEETTSMAANIVAAQGWRYDREASYAEKIAVINAVAQFVRTYREYDASYMAEAFDGENVNWSKVFFDKENYPDAKAVCRHYAASAIVLYKALGIPARYATGVAVQGKAGETLEINGGNRHAWVEIYIDGIGWIIVDPTGSSPDGEGGFPGGGNTPGGSDTSKPTISISFKNTIKMKYQNGAEVTYQGHYETGSNIANVTGLPRGYKCTFDIIGWASDPGKHNVVRVYNVAIFDADGNNVTSKFNIKTETGILHIFRDTLVFGSSSYTRVFDGHTPNGGSITHISGVMAGGHSYVYTFTADSGVGTFRNSFEIKIFANGKNVTDEYLIDTTTHQGEVTTNPKPVTFTAGSAEMKYDKTNPNATLTCQEIIYDPDDLAEGHRLVIEECVIEGSQTGTGTSLNTIKNVVIVDANGNDVSSWYEADYQDGTLRIYR